jgi:hypothetical protein
MQSCCSRLGYELLNYGIRCITLSRPVVLRGRICVASACESRHDTPTLEEDSSVSQTAFLRAISNTILTEPPRLPIVI